MNVVLSDAAEADLESIGDWIDQESPRRAIEFILDLHRQCTALGRFPKRFPLVPGLDSLGVRSAFCIHLLRPSSSQPQRPAPPIRTFPMLPSLFFSLVLQTVTAGLALPVQVVSSHDGSGRLFIAQQNGKILIHDDAGLRPRPFLDIADVSPCCENGGLLSVVFHPRYRENGELFVLYVDRNADTAVARYRRSANDPELASPAGELLFTVPQPKGIGPNHHGGTLQFGPDGYLYISIGDGGNGEHVLQRAQDLSLRAGKLLRIDVDRGAPYTIPPDNPFAGAPGVAQEIFAYGLRNPWRFSFDRATGELLLGDVGHESWEELDLVTLDEARGANFGWPRMEGMHCFPPGSACEPAGITQPALEYPLTLGCSVTGGYRYRGTRWPALAGRYLYGDWCSGRIWAAWEEGDGRWTSAIIADTEHAIVSFGEDDAGELYAVDYNGALLRVTFPDLRRRAARR